MDGLFGEHGSPHLESHLQKMTKNGRRVTRTLYDYFNLDIFSTLPTVGKEQMPVLEPVDADIKLPNDMVAFDEAFTKKKTNCIVHFFTDDRRFLRIFRNPKKYLPFLKKMCGGYRTRFVSIYQYAICVTASPRLAKSRIGSLVANAGC